MNGAHRRRCYGSLLLLRARRTTTTTIRYYTSDGVEVGGGGYRERDGVRRRVSERRKSNGRVAVSSSGGGGMVYIYIRMSVKGGRRVATRERHAEGRARAWGRKRAITEEVRGSDDGEAGTGGERE